MEAVKRGGDRQDLHERIRQHSMAAGNRVKMEGAANDLLERIAADSAFAISPNELESMLDASLYVGRSASQVEEYLRDVVEPMLAAEIDQTASSEATDIKV